MSSAEAELQRRRERGRLAQSAFRKRQAQAKLDTESENSRLKHAIEAIVHETIPDDRPELRAKIWEAAKTAGLDLDSPDVASRVSSSTISPVPGVNSHDSLVVSHSRSGSMSSDQPILSVARNPRSPYHQSQVAPWDARVVPDPFQYLPSNAPPADTLPFLGAGAHTFAGRMFWSIIEKANAAYDDVHKLKPSTGPTPMIKVKPQCNLSRMVGQPNAIQDVSTTYLITVIEARLGCYKRCPTNRPAVVFDDRDHEMSTLWQLRHVEHDYASRGESTNNWLTPAAAENRIRRMVGDEVFALLASEARDSMEPNNPNGGRLVDGLFYNLSDTFVCYGHGPRWNVDVFDGVFKDWFDSIAGQLVSENGERSLNSRGKT